MKRVINGRTYNTETATLVARWGRTDIKEHEISGSVFKTRAGAFFVVHQSATPDCSGTYFMEMTQEDVDNLLEEADNLEILDKKALSEPPEA